ncbi:hypothetical protein Tco_0317073 [Tanacetum coccineum]
MSSVKDNFHSMITTELAATALQQIDEFLQRYMQTHVVTFHPPASIPIPALQEQLYNAMRNSPDAQAVDPNIHTIFRKRNPDGPPEGEKSAKKQKTTKGTNSVKGPSSSKHNVQESKAPSSTKQHDFDGWYEVQEIDDDEAISKEASLEFLAELKSLGKVSAPIIDDTHRMKQMLDDMMRERCKTAEDIEILRLRRLSLHKIHATPFSEDDLEELLERWVGKVFKRSDPKEVYSNLKIVEVMRVENEQGYEQDFMEEIVVKRADGNAYIFSESNYKYLNKNDIEDMYLMRLKRETYHKNGLLNSLIVFIESCVIWERVHDYQLRNESYQIKNNLTVPTLVIHGIEELEPYTIINDPFI